MKRDDHFYKEKRIIYLKKKLDELRRKLYTPWTKLDVPLHRGWEVSWILRNDIQRRSDYEYILKAFNEYNTAQVCRKLVDAIKIKNDPYFESKWEYSNLRRIWNRYISDETYESLEPSVKKYIHKISIYPDDKLKDGRIISRNRLNIPRYWLVPVISKHYITQVRTLDNEVQKEMNELDEELDRITDGHPWSYSRYHRWEGRFSNRSLRRSNKIKSKLCLIEDEVDFKPHQSVRW